MGQLLKLKQLIITVYYLKFSQIFWRLYYFFKPRNFFLIKDDFKINNNLKINNIRIKTKFLTKQNSILGPHKFIFLNETCFISKELEFKTNENKKLWLYNLNYFDFLNSKLSSKGYRYALQFLESWLKNKKSSKYLGYDPYPTSLRIINWIKFYSNSNNMDHKIKLSLFNQTEFLYHNLEWHLLGNHILANAKALIFAGVFFSGRKASKWKLKGIKIFQSQIKEQILKDGGHFEKTPMYHAILIEDILDIINISDSEPNLMPSIFKDQLISTAEKMLIWLETMSFKSGEMPHFNDSTKNISHDIKTLNKYAKRLGLKIPTPFNLTQHINVIELQNSGFVRIDQKNALTFLDVGSIGASYIPGHAHADTMSFETSFFNSRFFLNLGISTYENSKRRLLERGTSSHNTVEIDGKNSSGVWSSFRVSHRAKVFDLRIKKESNFKAVISCYHDGYNTIFKKNHHYRKWVFEPQKIKIIDQVSLDTSYAVANFNLDPQVKVSKKNQNDNYILNKSNKTVNFLVKNGEAKIVNKFYALEFGRLEKTKCISIKLQKGKSEVIITW